MTRGARLGTDAIEFYLDDLATVSPLSREAELELALRIDEAYEAARRALLESRVAPRLVLGLLDALAQGTISASEIAGAGDLDQFDELRVHSQLLAGRDQLRGLVSVECRASNHEGSQCACVTAHSCIESLPFNRATIIDLLSALRVEAEGQQEQGWGAGTTARAAWQAARHQIAGASRAKTKLAEANLRLVVAIARRYAGRGLPLGDLIQEGNLGLLKAIDLFDPHRGFRLSTYASWWIRQSMQHALSEQTRTIRVPRHMTETAAAAHRFARGFRNQHQRPATPVEIAEGLGLSRARVEAALDLLPDAISLETPLGGEDDGLELGDTVADSDRPSPADVLLIRDFSNLTREALDTLEPHERGVVSLRFGIDEEGVAHSVEEVATMLGVAPERVRQTEARALRKLKQAKRTRALRSYARE